MQAQNNDDDVVVKEEEEEEERSTTSSTKSSSSTMDMEEDELDMALELKDVVENQREDLRPLSDFMYAVHAIAAHGGLETAIERVEGLQYFQDEYGIVESTHGGNNNNMVSEGVQAVRQFLELWPSSILSANSHKFGDEQEDVVVVAWDLGQIFPERMFRLDREQQTDRHWKIHVRGWYYMHHAWFPNLAMVRNGNVALLEGSTFGWENFSPKCEKRHQEEFFLHYPSNPRKVMFFNTNVVLNTFVSMIKPILPKSMQDAFEVGCTVDPIQGDSTMTLRDLLLQPSPKIAQQNVLRDVQKLLEERNKNEQSFRLSS